jgi:hypothetical protein
MFGSCVFGANTSDLIFTRYSRLPQWLHLSSSEQTRVWAADAKDAKDDLAHPQSIAAKLKEMMALVANVSDNVNDEMSDWQMMAAFYSRIHLHTELNLVDPDYLYRQYQSKTILKHYHYSEALSIFTSFYVLSLTIACHVSST